jgi:hypothetical protein
LHYILFTDTISLSKGLMDIFVHSNQVKETRTEQNLKPE